MTVLARSSSNLEEPKLTKNHHPFPKHYSSIIEIRISSQELFSGIEREIA
jgi:hypothetical protein